MKRKEIKVRCCKDDNKSRMRRFDCDKVWIRNDELPCHLVPQYSRRTSNEFLRLSHFRLART